MTIHKGHVLAMLFFLAIATSKFYSSQTALQVKIVHEEVYEKFQVRNDTTICPPVVPIDEYMSLSPPGRQNLTTRKGCIEVTYEPSEWESYWAAEISKIATFRRGWECGCLHMLNGEPAIESWLGSFQERESEPSSAHELRWDSHVFSFHRYTDVCSASRPSWKVPIEPLVGFLRHPRHHCFFEALANKNYMFPTSINEIFPPPRKSFLFDLGASTYLSGFGGASQSWFVETYEKYGVHFDRILAWEAAVMNPNEIFREVPANVLNNLTYFNVPADPVPNAKHNPLRILLEITRPEDFVVLKLDIDNSAVETALIKQVLKSTNLLVHIDEVYFEHHVAMSPVHWSSWGDSVGNATLPESYEMFQQLRANGIRAHSWV